MSEQDTPNVETSAGGTGEGAAKIAPATSSGPSALPAGQHYFWGTGRRKNSVARVRIRPGSGKFQVNDREYDEYFKHLRDKTDVVAPLKETKTLGAVDVFVKVHGGGSTGQAGAVLLGVARALKRYDSSLEHVLRDEGFLTRDAREVERKKPGQPGARRRFQFSKR